MVLEITGTPILVVMQIAANQRWRGCWPREKIEARMASRKHHYTPTALLNSQLATLEPPGSDENVLEVNIAGTPEEEVAEVLHVLQERIGSKEESHGGHGG